MSYLYDRLRPFLGDEQNLHQRMAGRMDLWEECIRLFPDKEIFVQMDMALQTEDDTAVYKELHRLKGCLANFGFDSAAGKAKAVLQAIKEADRTQIMSRYVELKEEYMQIIERVGNAK